MLAYNLKLALLSIRHRKGLAIIMVVLIAIGVGAVMTMLTVVHNMGADPIPDKSDQLYVVQLDNQEQDDDPSLKPGDLPERVTYQDAMYFLGNKGAAREVVALYDTSFIVGTKQGERPYYREGLATNGSFFRMFEVPFKYGGPWSAALDAQGAEVAVIDQQLNDRLFGGGNSVGKSITLGSTTATIVGVIGDWTPSTRYYDSSMNPTYLHQVYVPLNFALTENFSRGGNPMSCWDRDEEHKEDYRNFDVDGLKSSECTFINLWVELSDESAHKRYMDFVDTYIDNQRSFGRYPRSTKSFVTGLKQWMKINKAVRPQFNMFVLIAVLFLLICITNMVAIVLAKQMGKTKEVCIRRALGADRPSLFAQNLTEIAMIGAAGGISALILSAIGLVAMHSLMVLSIGSNSPMFDQAFQLDLPMACMAIGLAILSAVAASLYPVWWVCSNSPAFNLKEQ